MQIRQEAANSATPKSTAYDEQNEPPKVVTYEENLVGNMLQVSAMLEDEDGIGSVMSFTIFTMVRMMMKHGE